MYALLAFIISLHVHVDITKIYIPPAHMLHTETFAHILLGSRCQQRHKPKRRTVDSI